MYLREKPEHSAVQALTASRPGAPGRTAAIRHAAEAVTDVVQRAVGGGTILRSANRKE
jgi:hypothetical protein